MFVDSSALTAMLTGENDTRQLLQTLVQYPKRITSPLVIWETVIAVARNLALDIPVAERGVAEFLKLYSIEIVPVPPESASLAVAAHRRYGRARHPAALNFGDCFAYACARHYGVPLLYKGDDFSKTDIKSA